MKVNYKSLISWVIYIAFLVVLVYGTPRVLAYVLDTSYPIASITSGSMWPTLKKGDLVLIKGINDKSEINIGDIVVYQNPEGFTIHRIVEMNENKIVTKGDANNTSDKPVEYEEIIGKTLTVNNKIVKIPLLGNISVLVRGNNL